MKVITCYTDSHIPLLAQHYLPSLPAGFEAELIHLPQECPSGEYMGDGWTSTVRRKLEIIRAACLSESRAFLLCDADVRFYPGAEKLTPGAPGNSDVSFQDHGDGQMCTGFVFINPNARSHALFDHALSVLDEKKDDQLAVNAVLSSSSVGWGIVTTKVWAYGQQLRKNGEAWHVWEPGMPLEPPAGLLVHHASWTKGIANKLAMLDEVRRIRDGR